MHSDSSHCPLAFCRAGEEVEIVCVLGGRKLHNRIKELGLLPGTRIKVIQSNPTGPVLINYRGSNIALGHGMAHHLMVKF